jgi:hypothetical protein
MYVVCASLVSVVLVSLLSLYIWFVQPADTAADAVELLPEERKQVVEGEYDIAKAEEILKLFESRATSSR